MSRSVIWRLATVTVPIVAITVASVVGTGLLGAGKAAPAVANGRYTTTSNRLEWRLARLEALASPTATPGATPGPPTAYTASRPATQPAPAVPASTPTPLLP